MGSGFFVSAEGILVTNHHVVAKARYATVLLSSNATLFVDGVLAIDEQADLAILKVNGQNLPFLRLAQAGETPPVGTRVYAIGNPQGLTNTLSEGLISGVRILDGDRQFLQTTAAISPGSSGGPVLNVNNVVVGVATMSLAEPHVQNLNFAVPAGRVRMLLDKAATSKPIPLTSSGGQRMDHTADEGIATAMKAIDEQRWNDAVDILQRLRRTHPSNPQVWYLLGMLHVRLGNHELALEAFRENIRLAPDNGIGHFGTGVALAGLGRHAEAVQAYQTATRLAPEFWPAYTHLGISLRNLRRYTESIVACRNAIRLRPDDADAYYTLALDHLAMGNRAEAGRIRETLRRLDPALAADLSRRLLER